MTSVNKVILVGNLGKDPESRQTASGAAICSLTVATSRNWKDKVTGDKREETEWHRVTLFDRLAEIAMDYLRKGRPVYIEGRLKTRKYTDKDGLEKYATDIIATEMQLLGGREEAEAPREPRASPPAPKAPPKAAPRADDDWDDPPF